MKRNVFMDSKKKQPKKIKERDFTPERALKIGVGIVTLGVVTKLTKELF